MDFHLTENKADISEPQHDKTNKMICAPSEDANWADAKTGSFFVVCEGPSASAC